MSKVFPANIYQADSVFFEGSIESLVVPTSEGMYGILAGHRNVLVAIVPGEMHFNKPGEEPVYAQISEGMLRMEDGEVLILADTIELPEEAANHLKRLQEEEKKEAALQKKSVQEYLEAEMTLQRTFSGLRKHDYHHDAK